ncbi:MAG TPA: AMP-binding protein [Candidatus Eisenbacteria bacterium]|jgi:long-chain acyl-CoA synthetase|nr:AMP-binding protein [Candidatus Eisenbacteria bacterium]
MANFLENIFARLQALPQRVVLREVHSEAGDKFVSVTAAELLSLVERARAWLRSRQIAPGERCGLVAVNSIHWIATDLALMAEGIVAVPLYHRQTAAELAAMLEDCQPRLVLTGDSETAAALTAAWPQMPPPVTLAEIFPATAQRTANSAPRARSDSNLLTVIYTSGTSGEPKGVCLSIGNLNHMTGCTTERLDQLMAAKKRTGPDSIFLYAPMNFAAPWMLMLSALLRESVLTLSTDLNKLADEIRLAAPHYFLNVPTLLERVKRGVEDNLAKQFGPIQSLYKKARDAWQRQHVGRGKPFDSITVALGRKLIFSKVTARFGPNLRALICGSAPLAPETQQWFLMLGIPVLQAYGLTETTALCTLDDPRLPVEAGYVGRAVPGIDMQLAENDEIIVRGPNIFSGYWNRPEETGKVLRGDWFHTGDQGEVNASGNWRIIGRIKNLLVLNTGHKFAPEPIEDKLTQLLSAAQQIVLIGNARSYVTMLVAGKVEPAAVQGAVDAINLDLPHYRQIRNFHILPEGFTPDSGLLTANGKLKRDAIAKRYDAEINSMYARKASA